MQLWEMQLRVRKKACEGRLNDLRERHGNTVLLRNRNPQGGPSWHKKNDKLAWLRHLIKRELWEIRYVNQLLRVGPIAGNATVLWVRNGATGKVVKGPNILELIERERDAWFNRNRPEDEITSYDDVVKGLEIALEIINNPYRFLNEDQRKAAEEAEERADAIISNRAGTQQDNKRILPGGKPGPSLAQARAQAASTTNPDVVVRRKSARD